MSFNKHSRIVGQHAFLSPSNYHWLGYDEDTLRRVFYQKRAASRGDKLHAFAQQAIELNIKQPENGTTLSTYINDAIGFRMEPEVPLYYSDNCFGTADAACFRDMTLRVHDLKTGITPADMKQLKIYAAIFCFEYGFSPDQIRIILRIYQNDAIEELEPDSMDMFIVMDQIKTLDVLVTYLREED